MKSVTAALQAHFGLDCTTLAVLWKVTRQDGAIMGFTTHDQDIVYLGVTYAASTGFTNSANQGNSDMSVDNMEVTGFLDSSAIDEHDLRAQLYDDADIEMRVVNWADLSMGDLKLRSGDTGVIKMVNGMFQSEIRGLTQKFTTVLGSTYGPTCRAELGSGPAGPGGTGDPTIDPGNHYKCGIDLSAFRQNGSVNTSADAVTIVPNSGLLQVGSGTPTNPAPANWFNDGFLQFTSGALSGYKFEIKSWDGATLTLFLPMPSQPAHGDTFSIEPGCNKLTSDCFGKFNNIVNFRGESFIPGPQLFMTYPNANN